MTIGEFSGGRVRGHRQGRGLSREEVARRIGRTVASLKGWECGDTAPSAAALAKLASCLTVPIGDLFRRHDDDVLDYVDAIARHVRPMTDDEIATVAEVVRRIQPSHRRPRQSRSLATVSA